MVDSNAVISSAEDFRGYDEEGNSNTSFASCAMSSLERSAASENTNSSPVSVMQDLDRMKRRLCELERENSELRFLSPSPWMAPSSKKFDREPPLAYEEDRNSSSYRTACQSLDHLTGIGVFTGSELGHNRLRDPFRGENHPFDTVRRKESKAIRREVSLTRDDENGDGLDFGRTGSTFSSLDNDNYSMASMEGSMDIISAVGSMEDSVDISKDDTPRQEGERPCGSMHVSNRRAQHEKENVSGESGKVRSSHCSHPGLDGFVTNPLRSKRNFGLGYPAEEEGESKSKFDCVKIPPPLSPGDGGECRQANEHSRRAPRRGSNSRREGAVTRRSSATQQLPRGSSKKSHCSNDEQDEVKYSLDSKSRYFCADGQFGIHPPANAVESSDISTPNAANFATGHEEPLQPSSTKLSSTKLGITSSGDDVAARLAQSMVVEKQRQSDNTLGMDGTSRGDAFQQFFLLSISGDDDGGQVFEEESAVQGGSRFLDTFRYHQAHVKDSFTSSPALGGSAKLQEASASASFDVAALSPFCFPGGGVRARLVPKCAVDRAKSMGWMGRHADTYQLLVFTDGSGVTSHGVAVTTREQITSENLVADLALRRRRRRSAVVLSRWWRKRRSSKVVPQQLLIRQGSWRTGNRKATLNASQDVGGRRKLDWVFKREASSRSLTSAGEESDKNDGSDAKTEDVKRRRSLDWVFKRESSVKSLGDRSVGGRSVGGRSVRASRRRKDKKQNKFSKSKKWARPVSEVLDEFLQTSPIQQYDPALRTGIWCSAKLKVSRKKNQCEVIILYAPLTAEGEELEAIWKQLEEERSRLIVLLTNAYVPCGDSSKTLSVTSFRFEEKEGLATEMANQSMEISESTRQLAAEAYKSMQMSEAMGEVCIVERCYVLMGGKPDELSLLLAGLQQLVDVERKEKRLEMKRRHTGPKTIEKVKQNTFRHRLLFALQTQARPSPKREIVPWPKSDHMFPTECRRDFSKISTSGSSLPPIQLPQIAGQWGLSTLLQRIGANSLMKVLKLLLLEHSVLLIGLSTEEVSSCTCTLIELLKPFEWASTFLPLLPVSMLDFVNSPVPFIVGMATEGAKEMGEIESDYRVYEATQDGMCVVNLVIGTVAVELSPGDEEMFVVPPELSQRLDSLQSKLEKLRAESKSPSKSLRSFVQNGLTCNETLALLSVRHSIWSYVTGLCGDLAVEQSAWRQYGKYNEKTNGFDFYPNRFLAPHRLRLELMEEVVNTKMFAAFVQSKRDDAIRNELQGREIHRSSVANCA